MDPISTVNVKKDSTVAMMITAQARGWELFYMVLNDLYIQSGQARANARGIRLDMSCDDWFRLEKEQDLALAELDLILMRKDPPVDDEFIYATHILELAENEGSIVCNRPRSLRDCNEKLYALQFPHCCPPHLVSRDITRLSRFLSEHQDVIFKPLNGMGGASIFHVREGDSNMRVILETLTAHGTRQIMAQRFIPEIEQGDKRILIVDGTAVPYALARIPPQGEHRGNLAAGGTGEARPLSERDRWIVNQVRDDLISRGLTFVGIDVIGDYLTEINVTSPTCIQELNRSCGLSIADSLLDALVRQREQRPQ
jgi:glutathione synthase